MVAEAKSGLAKDRHAVFQDDVPLGQPLQCLGIKLVLRSKHPLCQALGCIGGINRNGGLGYDGARVQFRHHEMYACAA